MTNTQAAQLAGLLGAVERALEDNRALLNQSDPLNGNHGDHMIEIFAAAAQAAGRQPDLPLGEAMLRAAHALDALGGNGSAEVYGRGLRRMAEQFARYNVSVDDLVSYVSQALRQEGETAPVPPQTDGEEAAPSGDVLKALVNGLASWAQSEPQPDGSSAAPYKLSMGALFEFGMAYLQAKQRGGSKAQVIADAAAGVSPLSSVPHRYQSARLAIEALLNAIVSTSSGAAG
jgi:hypothetical protein